MVIFLPYYRQYHQYAQSRTRSSLPDAQNNATTMAINATSNRDFKFASRMLCRFAFSLFLFTVGLFLFHLSLNNASNQIEGSYIVASILLIASIISFIQTCHTLRQYHIIMDTRRRLLQRLRERQQAYSLALALSDHNNTENVNTDLPSYKELFPSHHTICNNGHDALSLPPPSYEDYIKTQEQQLSTNPTTQCVWVTDDSQRPCCLRGTVTYV